MTYTFTNFLYKFDTSTNTWSTLWKGVGTGPSKRAFHGSTMDKTGTSNKRLYIYGGSHFNWGYSGIVIESDFWVWDLVLNIWFEITATPNPGPRTDLELAYYNGKVYLFGGFYNTSIYSKNDLWAYTISTNTWTQLIGENVAGSPPGRHSHQFRTNTADGKIYLYGGESSNAGHHVDYNDTWKYNPSTNTWTDITPSAANNINPPVDTFYASDFVDTMDGGNFIMYGGQAGDTGVTGCNSPGKQNPTDKLYMFNDVYQVWTEQSVTAKPPKLKRHAGAKVGFNPSYFYIHGGWDFFDVTPCQSFNNDVWCIAIPN